MENSVEKCLTFRRWFDILSSVIVLQMLAGPVAESGNFLLRRFPFSLHRQKIELVKGMGDKPFKTYEELIYKLRDEKKLTIAPEDEAYAISLLKNYSYFSLVSGYKRIFKASDGTYIAGTTIHDIYALYIFDDCLRDTFFHAIQIVEKKIKSLLSYFFQKSMEKINSSISHHQIMTPFLVVMIQRKG